MKTYILRGACAGVAAALATAAMLLLLGESTIRDAIALEEKATEAAHAGHTAHVVEAHGDEMFSRTVQVGGGLLGVLLFGVFLGMIFGIVYAAVQHRLGPVADWKKATRLAGLGFLSIYLVPFLKYPPNPPAVGDPDTVNERTIAYLCLMGIAIITTVAAVGFAEWLARRSWPDHLRLPAAIVFWIAIISVSYAVLPANTDDIAVGAKLIWRFRLASLGGQVAFWAVLGLVFGWLGIRHSGRRVFATTDKESVATGG